MTSGKSLSASSLQERLGDLAERQWEKLSDSQKGLFNRAWKVLTYKWQWQIAFNAPFMVWWSLDKFIPSIHSFDMMVLSSLPIPGWINSLMGLS